MPSHNITEPGALSGIKDDDEKKRTRTVPVYEYQGQTPDLGGKKLQDVYGRGSLPMGKKNTDWGKGNRFRRYW